ncbi:MAG: hypothetical protein R3B09_11650 [Nannocystaceae bacterium]
MIALYRRFFAGLPVRAVAHDEHLHLLGAEEVRRIRDRHRVALALAASLAVLGFLAYYLPLYAWPEAFPSVHLVIDALGLDLMVPWAEILWGILLMIVEIYCLVLVNIWAVHEIAVATGVMDAETKATRGEAMLAVALEVKNTDVLRYGIDPYLGMNKGLFVVWNLVLRLKGFLGNKALRYLVQRLSGRFAVRELLDFVGVPIYMGINAYATHAVLREAKVVIMGQHLVDHLTHRLPADLVPDPEAASLLFDTLQVIAVSKRDFHHNHFLLTQALCDRYEIQGTPRAEALESYAGRVRAAEPALRRTCILLLVLGFVLDGQVSWRERRRIHDLREAGVLPFTDAQIKGWCRDFTRGAGLEPLLAAQEAEDAAIVAA